MCECGRTGRRCVLSCHTKVQSMQRQKQRRMAGSFCNVQCTSSAKWNRPCCKHGSAVHKAATKLSTTAPSVEHAAFATQNHDGHAVLTCNSNAVVLHNLKLPYHSVSKTSLFKTELVANLMNGLPTARAMQVFGRSYAQVKGTQCKKVHQCCSSQLSCRKLFLRFSFPSSIFLGSFNCRLYQPTLEP